MGYMLILFGSFIFIEYVIQHLKYNYLFKTLANYYIFTNPPNIKVHFCIVFNLVTSRQLENNIHGEIFIPFMPCYIVSNLTFVNR